MSSHVVAEVDGMLVLPLEGFVCSDLILRSADYDTASDLKESEQ